MTPYYPRWEPRPTYREPHPVRWLGVLAGAGAAAAWYLLFGVFWWGSAAGYVWLTIVAGIMATLATALLIARGDRGVAVGIALTSSFALMVAGVVLTAQWVRGDWLLW
ncbi:hypothetical protein [Longispora albida]|uniref:hypothetical protein n=1 Tax=Longispora albida TaxID=203523 RepID=UPI0003638664|nr:hypothetical protein [Longispora albida]